LSCVLSLDVLYQDAVPYHKGPGVKKSGPKGPRKIKGDVLESLLDEFDAHPSDPSHLIAERVTRKTGVAVSSRRIREIRHERGKSRSSRPSIAEARPPRNLRMRS
jgi:hypothetical protein